MLKGFRLQYSDDPDAEASEDIESLIPEEKNSSKSLNKKEKEEPLVTDKMLNWIADLVSQCKMSDEDFKAKFSYLPYDNKMPMRVARSAIDELRKLKDNLPF